MCGEYEKFELTDLSVVFIRANGVRTTVGRLLGGTVLDRGVGMAIARFSRLVTVRSVCVPLPEFTPVEDFEVKPSRCQHRRLEPGVVVRFETTHQRESGQSRRRNCQRSPCCICRGG